MVKKSKMKLSRCLFLEDTRKNFKLNLVFVLVLVPKSKALYYLLCRGSR